MQCFSEKILDKILELLGDLDSLDPVVMVLVVMVLVVMVLVVNFKKIIYLLEDLKSIKISKLKEALECDLVTGVTRSLLEQELATEHFKRATGLRLEKPFREAVIQAHNNNKGELDFSHFKRARSFLLYKNGRLTVEISVLDRLVFICNLIFALLLLLAGAGVFLVFPFIEKFEITSFLLMCFMGFFCICTATLLAFTMLPVASARKIKKRLENNNQPVSDLDSPE